MLVLNTLSDPFLKLAFAIGVGALGLTFLMVVQVIYLRWSLKRGQHRDQLIVKKWRPLMTAALMGEAPVDLPVLDRRDHAIFLKLWVHFQKSLRGDANLTLRELGYRLGCDEIAYRLLRRGNRAERLLAVLTLGHLQVQIAWPVLLQHAEGKDSTLSLYSFWALAQIAPVEATHRLAISFINRDDWPLSEVVNILQDAREASAHALADVLLEVMPERIPRALHLAEALRVQLPSTLMANLLQHESVEVVISVLRLAATPELRDEVRRHVVHPDWQVRVHVAKALGRIGDQADIKYLSNMLSDRQWWVRYRAAQALADSPFLSKQELNGLCAASVDRFASDMLKHVLAEKGTPWIPA